MEKLNERAKGEKLTIRALIIKELGEALEYCFEDETYGEEKFKSCIQEMPNFSQIPPVPKTFASQSKEDYIEECIKVILKEDQLPEARVPPASHGPSEPRPEAQQTPTAPTAPATQGSASPAAPSPRDQRQDPAMVAEWHRVFEAYDILSDPEQRKSYDKRL